MSTAFSNRNIARRSRAKRDLSTSIGDWSQSLLVRIWSVLQWIMQRARAQQARKNLRVCETVSLGRKAIRRGGSGG